MGEGLYELPKGWKAATVNELIAWDGIFVDGDWVESKDQDPSGDVRLIQLADVGDGFYRNKSNRYLTNEKAIELNCTFIKAGDVLVARMPDPLGRSCIFPGDTKSCVTVVDVCIVRTGSQGVNPSWLMYTLNSPIIRSVVASLQSGSTRKRISRGNFAQIKLPIPPLAEQHRIVAKIEELFTQLDAGVELLKKVKAKLKRYRQTVLKAAVEGNLTKEWREANQGELEPASVLLEGILKQRREKWEAEQLAKMKAQGKTPKDDSWKLKYKEAIAPDTSDLPELPDGWCWVTVEQLLSESMCNGLSIKGSETAPGVAALKLNAMTEYGFNYTFIRYLPINPKDVINIEIQENDFFVSRGNGTLGLVGRGTLAQKPPFTVIFPDTMIRLRLTDIINSTRWIPCIWQSRFIRSQIEGKVKTTAGIWKISQSELASITIPLASFIEQQQIVTEVERIFSVTDQLEKTINANLKRAEKLRQTILKQAFEGKLVPQDPNDEPAEKLLERIKAEKVQREEEKKSKRTTKPKSSKLHKAKTDKQPEAENKPKHQPKIETTQPHQKETTGIQLELFNDS